MIRHYYHVYADGDWRDAVTEHLAALEGLAAAAVTVGIVGSPQNRRAVREAFAGVDVETWVEAAGGWEQVTLGALRRDLAHHDDPVLYAHTKGAANRTRINDAWRRSMTALLVNDECAALLGEFDAVGCHWLTPEDWPNVDSPFFGGNFWWASATYLRTLPPLAMSDRYDAEQWIGLNYPRVADLLPGWPDLSLFAGDGVTGSCHHGRSCPQSQALMNPAARLSTQTTR